MAYKDPEQKREYQREYAQRPEARAKRQAAYKKWAKKNRDHLLAKEAKRRLEKRGQCLVASCRTRARKKGMEFDLNSHVGDIQQRVDSGVCELSGCAFDLSPGRAWNSPSIDRIDPNQGYIYSNIRVICHAMNVALGDWGENQLRELVQAWLAREPRP